MIGPTLETERLILRPAAAEDFEAWAAFSADPEATKHLGGPMERMVAWRSLCAMTGAWLIRGFSMFSVIERASGAWVGRLGPWMPEGWPGTEVGWGIAPAFQRKGYAVEGATAAIDWAFDNLGWSEVIHLIAPANLPSQRVAARLGSTLRGPGKLPPPLHESPVEIWAQSREAWRARRQA
ncbi:MAG: GNAT family N-acetyltransferase [Polyangiaceae bacterium]|nr:GNAT family N-acetyltransferase [Polyangiaceae bacterium]